MITGWGRSGSTLLDNMLGTLPSFVSTGELHYLWQRGLLEGHRCACGSVVRECSLWSAVLAAPLTSGAPHPAFLGRGAAKLWPTSSPARLGDLDPAAIGHLQSRAVRTRHTAGLLLQRRDGVLPRSLKSYVAVLASLYAAIRDATGVQVIVDSSKRPSDAAVLRLVPGIDPYIVHLVRDPRAVAYSWARHKPELGTVEMSYMPRFGPVKSTAIWTGLNLGAESLRLRFPSRRLMRVRYEDLVDHPGTVVGGICRMVGVPASEAAFGDPRNVFVAANHAVGGNPSRFTHGTVRLSEDDQWRRSMRRSDWAAATALAAPLLARYGYAFADGIGRGDPG